MTGAVRSRRAVAPPDRRGDAKRPMLRREMPLYARILRLRHLAPSGFLCFVYLEGSVVLAVLLALAELVSWWGVFVLPAVVALMVKLNDVVAGLLARPVAPRRPNSLRSGPSRPPVGPAASGAPATVPRENVEAGPPTPRSWADQLDVREQMARQSAARRYE